MRFRLLITLAAGLTAGGAPSDAMAQASPAEAFDAFLRVAATTGQSLASLNKVWPYPLNAQGESQREWHITGAHRIAVDVNGSRDTVRVYRVRWSEVVPDSSALRIRVSQIFSDIARSAGPAELCNDPMGAPAYLYAPQHVERVWRKGIAGAPTQLTWDVLSGPAYVIAIDVGLIADNRKMLRACATAP
jgi:hypothetical protein